MHLKAYSVVQGTQNNINIQVGQEVLTVDPNNILTVLSIT